MSSYFEVIPSQVHEAVASDLKLGRVIERLWGHGSGMYSWFSELSASEIESITEYSSGIAFDDIERLRRLFAEPPSVPNAYIEKSHDLHQTMLSAAFSLLGASSPDELANLTVYGSGNWSPAESIAHVTHGQCKELSTFLMRLDARSVVETLDLDGRTPADVWRASLTAELQAMIDCYLDAANNGWYVITATTG